MHTLQKKGYEEMNISESLRAVRERMLNSVCTALDKDGLNTLRDGDKTITLYDENNRCVGFVMVFPTLEAVEAEEEGQA